MNHSDSPFPMSSLHRRRRPRYRLSPSTPLLRWNSSPPNLTARKLAAGLWNLRFNEFSAADPPCEPLSNQVVERVAEAEAGCSKSGDRDVCYVVRRRKILKSKRVSGGSIVSELEAEVAKARSRIRELEAKKHSLRKKVKLLLSKLSEERIPQNHHRREDRKNSEAINELRERLIRERKSRRRFEILNAKLVNQLSEITSSSEQLMKDYEDEKKSRELLEELCDKLVQRITEDKTRLERLKNECANLDEELEEERKMLQLAEVWREERVQMKLVDAKLALEGKFAAMNALISELATLLRSASFSLDAGDLRKAEQILQEAAKSLSSRDFVEEFAYVPPKSSDVVSILRELEGNSSEIGRSNRHSSPEINGVDLGSASSERVRHNVSPVSKVSRSKDGDGKVQEGSGNIPRRRISACLENPHVARGMRGCIEWPKVIQKNVLKPKISEVIIESHKSQLRHVLKPKT